MNPRVTNVKPEQDFTLLITFSNGEIKKFDVKPYLEIGIFKELKEVSDFNNSALVILYAFAIEYRV